MRRSVPCTFLILLLLAGMAGAEAQTPAADPSARLREVLPADVAERVIARIAAARERQLPAQALENRALRFAERRVSPADIERSINAHASRMERAKPAIERGSGRSASDSEVDAAAEAMRKGVDAAQVSALAQSAPSGRSLSVPLFVIGSLTERGLPSDQALARVQERLTARATDAELQQMAREAEVAGRERGASAASGRRPADVGRPSTPGRPAVTPRPTTTPPAGATKRP